MQVPLQPLTNMVETCQIASSSSSRAPSPALLSDLDLNPKRFAAYDASTSPAPLAAQHGKVLPLRSSLPPSSPSRLALRPSPAKSDRSSTSDALFTLTSDKALLFGRKAKQGSPAKSGDAMPVLLPRSAKNASRQHALVRLVSTDDRNGTALVTIDVLGMNGVKIDGKRWRAKQTATLTVHRNQILTLDFWGWSAQVTVDLPSANLDDSMHSLLSSPLTPCKDLVPTDASSNLSSPCEENTRSFVYYDDDEEDEAVPEVVTKAPPVKSEEAMRLVETLNLDLAGLIASAITFQPQSTVDAVQVTKTLLREAGSMYTILSDSQSQGRPSSANADDRERRAVELWLSTVESTLTTEPFFGCIPNTGILDAAGNQVPAQFFYIPDKDPSSSRVEALEPFVKRVRGARTAGGGKQYFWKKPSLKKNR